MAVSSGTFFDVALTSAGVLTSLGALFFGRAVQEEYQKLGSSATLRREEIEDKVAKAPEDSRLAWDLARVTLEQYFNRNLQQVNQIFLVSVAVMLIGFGLILYGAFLAIHQPGDSDLPARLTTISGVITEFISVTFMLVYRSTLKQANAYMSILEKINAVGMAVQILESIPKIDPLYAETRSAMAKMLLEQFKTAPH